MNRFKRLLALVLAIAMILSMAAAMSGCSKNEDTTESTAGGDGSEATYTVSVKTKGGMALSGIAVYIYADSSLTDL